ncbi:hypothetical protein HDU86_000719 [Geranomyces michiganensis]|nr:hypothetical protein HDU86_000719 [Geranomyces michiganensis]
MLDDPEMTVDHIDGNRKNDVLDNLQFLPWLQNYRKGGDDQAAWKIYTDDDLDTAPAVEAQDWRQHPRLPHVECSRQGWLRKTGSKRLLPLQAGYYGRRHARVAGVVPWLAVHRAVFETWVGEIPPGMIVHRVAGNRTDNRPESLQLATPAENARWEKRSTPITRHRQPAYAGIRRRLRKWMAFMNANGIIRYLGLSTDKDVAIALRRKAEIALDYRPVNTVGDPDLVPDADPTTSVKKKDNLPQVIVMKERAVREYDFVPGEEDAGITSADLPFGGPVSSSGDLAVMSRVDRLELVNRLRNSDTLAASTFMRRGAVIAVPTGREFQAGKNLTSMANLQKAELLVTIVEKRREGGVVQDGDIGGTAACRQQVTGQMDRDPGDAWPGVVVEFGVQYKDHSIEDVDELTVLEHHARVAYHFAAPGRDMAFAPKL